MASTIKQFYGIKFPFTKNNNLKYFMDLNEKIEDKIASEILHVILTPKGTRIRRPDFGTELIKYIFEPDDSLSWDNVKSEVITAVETFVPYATLKDITVVYGEEDENNVYLNLIYSVTKGYTVEDNRLVVKIN